MATVSDVLMGYQALLENDIAAKAGRPFYETAGLISALSDVKSALVVIGGGGAATTGEVTGPGGAALARDVTVASGNTLLTSIRDNVDTVEALLGTLNFNTDTVESLLSALNTAEAATTSAINAAETAADTDRNAIKLSVDATTTAVNLVKTAVDTTTMAVNASEVANNADRDAVIALLTTIRDNADTVETQLSAVVTAINTAEAAAATRQNATNTLLTAIRDNADTVEALLGTLNLNTDTVEALISTLTTTTAAVTSAVNTAEAAANPDRDAVTAATNQVKAAVDLVKAAVDTSETANDADRNAILALLTTIRDNADTVEANTLAINSTLLTIETAANTDRDLLQLTIGNQADAAATSDTGSFSLLGLVKRALTNWTTLLGRIAQSPQNLTSSLAVALPRKLTVQGPTLTAAANNNIFDPAGTGLAFDVRDYQSGTFTVSMTTGRTLSVFGTDNISSINPFALPMQEVNTSSIVTGAFATTNGTRQFRINLQGINYLWCSLTAGAATIASSLILEQMPFVPTISTVQQLIPANLSANLGTVGGTAVAAGSGVAANAMRVVPATDASVGPTAITTVNANLLTGAATANSTVALTINNVATTAVQISAATAWTGTLLCQGTIDNINWFTIPNSTITSGFTGAFQLNTAGYRQVRITCSASITGGAATITLNASLGVNAATSSAGLTDAQLRAMPVIVGRTTRQPWMMAFSSGGAQNQLVGGAITLDGVSAGSAPYTVPVGKKLVITGMAFAGFTSAFQGANTFTYGSASYDLAISNGSPPTGGQLGCMRLPIAWSMTNNTATSGVGVVPLSKVLGETIVPAGYQVNVNTNFNWQNMNFGSPSGNVTGYLENA